MIASDLLLFGAAVCVLLCAHAVRAIRHSFLFAKEDLPERFALLLALSWGGRDYPWGSSQIVGLLAFGLALAVLFLFCE